MRQFGHQLRHHLVSRPASLQSPAKPVQRLADRCMDHTAPQPPQFPGRNRPSR